jgi:hypothetical protein
MGPVASPQVCRDPLTGQTIWSRSEQGFTAVSVAFSPGGKWLATGGWDRTDDLRPFASRAEPFTRVESGAHLRSELAQAIAASMRPSELNTHHRGLVDLLRGNRRGLLWQAATSPDGKGQPFPELESPRRPWDRSDHSPSRSGSLVLPACGPGLGRAGGLDTNGDVPFQPVR